MVSRTKVLHRYGISPWSFWVTISKKLTNFFQQRHGWPDDVSAPSAIAYKDKNLIPREMSDSEIQSLVEEWGKATERAVRAGFDVRSLNDSLDVKFILTADDHRPSKSTALMDT
jgi:hypothetical protein